MASLSLILHVEYNDIMLYVVLPISACRQEVPTLRQLAVDVLR
jgi:hypothetical protein